MKIEGYVAMVNGMKAGDVESANKAIRALYSILRYAAGGQGLSQFQKNYYEGGMTLMQYFMEAIEAGVISIVPGRHTQVEDDDFITRSSYEDHWQNKGRQFFEDLAKNIREREASDEVKGVEEGIQKAKKERAILERKAAAFDEIAGEFVGLYRAVNTVRACVDGDCDQYKVHLAMIDAIFSLGVVAQIIAKTKEDAA